ncbi:hypothetical protein CVS40_12293 [Lucilia cuprina]|nr:hypothetical protein CVS40_12293 [Lucilia cuprina]
MKIIKLFFIFGCIVASVMGKTPTYYNVQGVKDFTGIISSHGDNYNVQGVLNTGYSDTATGVKGAQENSNTRGVVNTGIFRKETK